jgi:hypothetical protein
MPKHDDDIEFFRQLCKQLQPLLTPDKLELLERIEAKLSGAGPLPVPRVAKIKKPTHRERVAKYL